MPGTLEEAIIIRTWAMRKQISQQYKLAQLLASQGPDLRQEAAKHFEQASNLELPRRGDVRALDAREKEMMGYLKSLTGKGLRITPNKAHGFQRVRSRLQRAQRANDQQARKEMPWHRKSRT